MYWLIVEDEADIRNLVAMMSQVWGHHPITFENGQKAWDWLDTIENGSYDGPLPEFALMDIRMPGYRGNEIAQRIRQIAPIQHIPIVLMTAFVLTDSELQEMRQVFGVDHIIYKPLPDFEDLRQQLHAIIERKWAG